MILSDIIAAIKGNLIQGKDDISIRSISTDSRKISQGELFIAIRGERFDGHDFIEGAITKGAIAVIVDNIHKLSAQKIPSNISVVSVKNSIRALGDIANWYRRLLNPFVIAITGSTGKTTTKEILARILETYAPTHFTKENYNNLIGLPLSLLETNKDHRFSVLEMGMNSPEEIQRLTEIAEPDLGIITNVGPAHIEAFGSMEGVLSAKLELIKAIRPYCPTIIDGDNQELVKKAKSYLKPLVRIGLLQDNDHVITIHPNSNPPRVILFSNINKVTYEFTFNIPVFTYLRNAATACSASIVIGIPEKYIQEGLNNFRGVKRRFEVIKLSTSSYLVDDSYNANPLSLYQGLQNIKRLFGKFNIILCLGDMLELGNHSNGYHKQVGEWISEINPGYVVLLGDYSEIMMKSALNFGVSKNIVTIATDIDDAYNKIIGLDISNSVIYIKGSNRTKLYQLADKIKESLTNFGGRPFDL